MNPEEAPSSPSPSSPPPSSPPPSSPSLSRPTPHIIPLPPPSHPNTPPAPPAPPANVCHAPPPIAPLPPRTPLPTPMLPSLHPSPPPGKLAFINFIASLDSLHATALRQNKWPLIILLPRHIPSSTPASSTSRTRPAWGPMASQQPTPIFASEHIVQNIIMWRRTANSSESERYTSFFPTDGVPHIALLDPRSGERLCVWGNQDGHGMQPNGLSDELWQTVEQDLKHFLQHHSLKNNALGPSHMAEKPWAVRTRRVSNVTSNPNLPSTSVMDDEDAAIAAAIAASLHDPLQSDVFDSSSSHDDHDNNSPDMSSESSESFNGDDEHELDSVSDEQEGKSEQDTEQPILREENNLNNTLMSMPVPPPLTRTSIVTQGSRDPLASSVESISSSYLERMDSRFRSSTNPSLMEDRRLRQEQDAELAACLQEDRSRDEMEQAKEAVQAHMKEQKLAAAARLPDEPAEKAVDIFTIAIRLEDGKKIIRRFNSFDKLRSVADFAIAETGNSTLTQFVPSSKLKVPGFNLGDAGWEVALQDLGLSRRTMFFLNM